MARLANVNPKSRVCPSPDPYENLRLSPPWRADPCLTVRQPVTRDFLSPCASGELASGRIR